MAVEPVEAVKIVEAAKSTWQWIAGGIVSGGYTVWKYFNHRLEKLENCVVTGTQFNEHKVDQEKKFDALFDMHREMQRDVKTIGEAVARLDGKHKDQRY